MARAATRRGDDRESRHAARVGAEAAQRLGQWSAQDVKRIADDAFERSRETRARAERARKLLDGQFKAPMPPQFEEAADRDNLRVDTPEKYVTTANMVGILAAQGIQYRRPPGGDSPRVKAQATRIESFVQAAMDRREGGFPRYEVNEHLLVDGVVALKVFPSCALWSYVPTLYDDISEAEYDALSAGEREGYEGEDLDADEIAEGFEGEPSAVVRQAQQAKRAMGGAKARRYRRRGADGEQVPRQIYQLDAEGRDRYDEHYRTHGEDGRLPEFEMDLGRSVDEYERIRKRFLESNFPVVMEALDVSRCAPIMGPGNKVKGLVVKTTYAADDLREAGFLWGEQRHALKRASGQAIWGQALTPDPNGDVTMIEIHHADKLGRPRVTYCVEGSTWTACGGMGSDGQVVTIDLFEEYGITRPLVGFWWGRSWRGGKWDKWSIPFTHHHDKNWLAGDGILTGAAAYTWARGWSTLVINRNGVDPVDDTDNDVDQASLDLSPFAANYVDGTVTEIGTSPIGIDAWKLIAAMQTTSDRALPGGSNFGGEADGYAAGAMSHQYMMAAQSAVTDAALSVAAWAASRVLEVCTQLGRRYVPVVLSEVGEIIQERPIAEQSMVNQTVELPPHLCGDVWTVVAEPKVEPGDNLVKAQHIVDAWAKGALLDEEMRRLAFGDEQAEQFSARKAVQELRKTPIGQIMTLQLAARIQNDAMMAEVIEMQAQGLFEKGDPMSALPLGLSQGLMGPTASLPTDQPGATPVPGAQVGNPAQSSLAGLQGGAMMAGAQAGAVGAGATTVPVGA